MPTGGFLKSENTEKQKLDKISAACNVYKIVFWQIYYATSFRGQHMHDSNITYIFVTELLYN